MSTINFSHIILTASKAILSNDIVVVSDSKYNISTNQLQINSYTTPIRNIQDSFGIKLNTTNPNECIQCGNTAISKFDFGLLYLIFSMIASSSNMSNLSGVVQSFGQYDTTTGFGQVWIDEDCLIYSHKMNILLQVKKTDMELIQNFNQVQCRNFSSKDEFIVTFSGQGYKVTDLYNNPICETKASDYIRSKYPNQFNTKQEVDEILCDTGLGELLGEYKSLTVIEALSKYDEIKSNQKPVDQSRLIITPNTPCNDISLFMGKWVYSDQQKIIMPINYTNGLLTYITSESITHMDDDDLEWYSHPKVELFKDIHEEFLHIIEFGDTITLKSKCYTDIDLSDLTLIRDAFLRLRLDCGKLPNLMGKIIISENNLLSSLQSNDVSLLRVFVPIGLIGTSMVTISDDDNYVCEPIYDLDTDGYFYDLTSILS